MRYTEVRHTHIFLSSYQW